MNQLLQEQYERLGISPEVSAFGEKIEASLKQRFEEIDARAEYNQLKVLKAMQDNRVSAECFNTTSGYGYNDLGRDTLEKVYASCFGGEDALVRPQITCGTHALALALMSNLQAIRYAGGSHRHPAFQGIARRVRHYLPSGGSACGRRV